MHENVDIVRQQSETKALLSDALLTIGSSGASGQGGPPSGSDKQLNEIAADIISKLPPPFEIEAASKKFPLVYAESMNTVLVQEMERYNK